jgi:hypothetical protein
MNNQPLTSHQFFNADGAPDGGQTFGPGLCIAWQKGPLGRGPDRQEPNGCFVETVIRAAADRLEFYQSGKFASDHNAKAVHHLHAALQVLAERTAEREKRQVEGTHKE